MRFSHNDMDRLESALESTTVQHSTLYLRFLSFVRASFRLGRRSVQHSLDNFGVLPLELREQIWLDDHDSPIVYAAPVCETKPLPLLCCCKALREEIISTITRRCEVKAKSLESLASLMPKTSGSLSTTSAGSIVGKISTPSKIYVDLSAPLGILAELPRPGRHGDSIRCERDMNDGGYTMPDLAGAGFVGLIESRLEDWRQIFRASTISPTQKMIIIGLGDVGQSGRVSGTSIVHVCHFARWAATLIQSKSEGNCQVEVDVPEALVLRVMRPSPSLKQYKR